MSELPQVPGYRIIKKLGHGGMADVYLGVQENLERKVAIKIMVPSLFRDEQFSRRFIKEAKTAANLTHPGILTIHDVGQAGDSYFIVMEYLEESLKDRLKKKKKMPPKEALDILSMIAAALDYAHKKGFIHRDIKPDNIMFRSDGTAVLVDFGIARAMHSTTQLTGTGMSIGTPHYMSPEQCLGNKVDGSTDIYSLGVVLYELLTGNVPYTAENTTGVILKQIQEPIPRLPEELAAYQHLVDCMMAKKKEERIRGGAELIKFIEAFDNSRQLKADLRPRGTGTVKGPVPADPTASLTAVGDRTAGHKKKKFLPLLIAGLIVAVGVTAYFLFFHQPPLVDSTDKPAVTPPAIQKDDPTNAAGTGQPGDNPPGETAPVGDEPSAGDKTAAATVGSAGEQTPPIVTRTEPPVEKPGPQVDAATRRQYALHLREARTLYKSGSYDRALERAGKAGEYMRTPELTTLEREIIRAQVRAAEEKKSPAALPVESSPVPGVTMLKLSAQNRVGYNTRLSRLQVRLINPRVKVHGQMVLDLSVDPEGRLDVVSYDDKLTVLPAPRKERILTLILNHFRKISLSPPRDKDGKPVRLTTWRVSYKVGKLTNKIILTKQ